jgi:ABC-type transport system involved in cytochrome c biogenesis permease component
MIPLVLLTAIGSGLTYFLINQLPKKIGYPKYILVCLGYIIFIGVTTAAVTKGMITGAVFLMLLFLPIPVGVLCLRHELIEELKNAFKSK